MKLESLERACPVWESKGRKNAMESSADPGAADGETTAVGRWFCAGVEKGVSFSTRVFPPRRLRF